MVLLSRRLCCNSLSGFEYAIEFTHEFRTGPFVFSPFGHKCCVTRREHLIVASAVAKGASAVTAEHMLEMAREYGIDEELMSRFKTD